jgi:hypothetical protein
MSYEMKKRDSCPAVPNGSVAVLKESNGYIIYNRKVSAPKRKIARVPPCFRDPLLRIPNLSTPPLADRFAMLPTPVVTLSGADPYQIRTLASC